MDRAHASYYQDNREVTIGKSANITDVKIISKKWRFKPRSIWPFVMWGLAIFAGLKITVIPLVEGIYNYAASTSEIHQLKSQYATMQKQIGDIQKKRDYMKTPSYVEERAHEIGLVKPDESQMVVMEGVADGNMLAKKSGKKKVEIGN
jgi:hypothetical protein